MNSRNPEIQRQDINAEGMLKSFDNPEKFNSVNIERLGMLLSGLNEKDTAKVCEGINRTCNNFLDIDFNSALKSKVDNPVGMVYNY